MKKLVLGGLMALAMVCGANAYSNQIWDKLALYLPNRILDAMDTFTVELGFGPVVRCELMATEWVKGDAGVGITARAIKGYNRQYGFGLQSGWQWQFVTVGGEDIVRTDTTRWVQEYRLISSGIPDPNEYIYNIYDGAIDFWRIGGALGLGVEGEVYLHPIDIADFVTGFFFIDLKGDDLTAESFQ